MRITKEEIRKSFITTVPVLTGYVVLGIGFGMILRSKGYGLPWAAAMSLLVYAGSMQYAALGLIDAGASLLVTAVTTLAVNARHLFYGISMIDRYRGRKRKPFLIFGLTDETYSLVVSDAVAMQFPDRDNYFFLVTLFDYIYWVSGSILGNALGGILPFDTEGIDFALTALFLTVFVEQWRGTKDHVPALTGVLASVLCLVIFGSGSFLIPAMILITVVLLALRRREERVNGGGGS